MIKPQSSASTIQMVMAIVVIVLLNSNISNTMAQQTQSFTRQDTLRGSVTSGRAWWDLTYYDLFIEVFPDEERISGRNTIFFKPLEASQKTMQIDLQDPLQIDSVIFSANKLTVKKDGFAHFIDIPFNPDTSAVYSIDVYYSGNPIKAQMAPWDGGIVWKKTKTGEHFIASAVQGLGASAFWPCKDHMYDEPDSMKISVEVPENLINVSNGMLIDSIANPAKGTQTYIWFVSNPINNYGVSMNIADYAHFSEEYAGEKGTLSCNYYVLPYNLEKAKKQFEQVSKMLDAFEHWFGPYPFYEDGFKLVETPYLGMEHQSCVAYGNGYKNGYLGRDLSGSGWGSKFDYIIIHESGHEWFANNITYKDIADMWIHEAFTCYSENLYLDYHFGKEAASEYVIGMRQLIKNDVPLIGKYGVNESGSGDMYFKGANMLHTIRTMVNDDTKWRSLLRGINKDFYHQTVTTRQVENYLIENTGIDLKKFFDQYLREINIPIFEYKIDGQKLSYRFTEAVKDFTMPVDVIIEGEKHRVSATDQWQTISLDVETTDVQVDENYYVKVKKI